jgi:phage host-nuclease inhibitor protein Gam
MTLREERRMVFDMLAEGKITVKEAEGLLDALEESFFTPFLHTSKGSRDFTCCGSGDFSGCQHEFESYLEENEDYIEDIGDLEAVMGDFESEMGDLEAEIESWEREEL